MSILKVIIEQVDNYAKDDYENVTYSIWIKTKYLFGIKVMERISTLDNKVVEVKDNKSSIGFNKIK